MGCFIKMEQAVGRILVSDKPSDNVGFENPTYVFGFVRGQSPCYVCCVQTRQGFKFRRPLGAVFGYSYPTNAPDNVGFENPTYVFAFIRGQSPCYVCCAQTGQGFKFQTTFGGCRSDTRIRQMPLITSDLKIRPTSLLLFTGKAYVATSAAFKRDGVLNSDDL